MEIKLPKAPSKTPAFFWHLKVHWVRWFTALVTGVLTYSAGWNLTSSFFYSAALVALAEGTSLAWPGAMERAEDVDGWESHAAIAQLASSVFGIIVSWVAIISTDLASITIIASMSNIKIFSAFAEVPTWAQNVVVYVVPILAVTHGILATIYWTASPEAAHSRQIAKINREADRQIKTAEANADAEKAKAKASEFALLATEKAREAGRAEAALMVERYAIPVQLPPASYPADTGAVNPPVPVLRKQTP